jgi:hypothetical protein
MARNVSPLVSAAVPLALASTPPARKRRNLVFVRCGANSLHRKLYPLPADRNWDCALSCYDTPLEADGDEAEFVFTGAVSKWDAFSQIRFDHPEFGFDAYERFFLVDEDVDFARAADIVRLFDIAAHYDLAACQPALSPQSFAVWSITRQHPSWFMRQTNFVECMVPVLSADAVDVLEGDIRDAVSGCGLDLVMAKVLGPGRRMAVIDAVTVTHTKPVDSLEGTFYKYLRSIGVNHDEEIAWFLAKHGMANFGAATLGGMPLVQHIYPAASA